LKTHQKLAFVILITSLVSVGSSAAEKKVKMSDLPPAVQATVKEQSKGATVRGYSSEVENGKTLYEVELMVKGHSKDVSMDSTGAVVEVEEQVALSDIPAPAKEAIMKGAGKGKVLIVEAVSKGNGEVEAYEAQVRTAGKKAEVRVAPDGSPKPE
jgi:uncharacterized cupredoxin-like copper-binding protein